MIYYIYWLPSNYTYYCAEQGECRDDRFDAGWNNFALTINKGEYAEEGYCCGAASWYGYKNCHIIGETYTKYEFEEDDMDVSCTCEYIIVKADRTDSVEDGGAWVSTRNSDPYCFTAKDDEEAFKHFSDYCIKNREAKV